MFLFGRCCKFLIILRVLFFPTAERVNATWFGPYHKCGQGFGAGVVEQDVHADGLVYLPNLHGEVQRLQEFPQQLVSGSSVGEGELAEGGHRYGAVRAASSAFVSLVV